MPYIERQSRGEAYSQNDRRKTKLDMFLTQTDTNTLRTMRPRNSDVNQQWRVFCAVEVPNDVRQRIAQHAERLRQALPDVKASWTNAENIHLTLKFFGNISPEEVRRASTAAGRAVRALPTFNISVEESGAFPDRGPAKVVWVGIKDISGSLMNLHARLAEECSVEGFLKEDRKFHPHLTLARLRSPNGARALAEKHKEIGFGPIEVTVSQLVLFRSQLSPQGSIYTAISHHSLQTDHPDPNH